MMKKIILIVVLVMGFSYVSFTVYAIATLPMPYLLGCANPNKAYYLPESACRFYLFNFRGTAEDIYQIRRYKGLTFVLNTTKDGDYDRFVKFFISKGMDINEPSDDNGFTPLHHAVLMNYPKRVKYLLSMGADPLIKATSPHLNTYGFYTLLEEKSKDQGIDRSEVRDILQQYKIAHQ